MSGRLGIASRVRVAGEPRVCALRGPRVNSAETWTQGLNPQADPHRCGGRMARAPARARAQTRARLAGARDRRQVHAVGATHIKQSNGRGRRQAAGATLLIMAGMTRVRPRVLRAANYDAERHLQPRSRRLAKRPAASSQRYRLPSLSDQARCCDWPRSAPAFSPSRSALPTWAAGSRRVASARRVSSTGSRR